MKTLTCREAGFDCDYVVEGETEEEILQKGQEHGKSVHGLKEEDCTPEVRDVALIAAAQRVEHYEIAAYGCAKTYARLLGYTEVEELLEASQEEEGSADKKLTELAEAINAEALEPAEAED